MVSLRISIFDICQNESNITRPLHPAGNPPRPHVHDRTDPSKAKSGRKKLRTIQFKSDNLCNNYFQL